mgnify:CR=1 FL=1
MFQMEIILSMAQGRAQVELTGEGEGDREKEGGGEEEEEAATRRRSQRTPKASFTTSQEGDSSLRLFW